MQFIRALGVCSSGEYVSKLRAFLLEAYVTSRYGDVEYSRSGVEPCSSLARGLVELLEEVCRSVKLG